MPWHHRAAIFLKAADLLAGPYRAVLNAATMLGQSKTVAPGRDRRRLRADRLLALQRRLHAAASTTSSRSPRRGCWNYLEHRPLEGFVFAVTPFNFTSIAGNLPTAPALMGNTVVWKPASSAVYSAHFIMELLEEAGLPPGVINMVPGSGGEVGDPVLDSPDLAGIHFTGSTEVFKGMWDTSRRQHRALQVLPAHRRRDRRQGLRLRPPLGRRPAAGHRAGARRLRVPGAEVLGRLARLHPRARSGRACRSGCSREIAQDPDGRPRRLHELHGRGDRPRAPSTRSRATSTTPSAPRTRRSWPAAAATRARATSSSPRSCWPRSPTSSCCGRRSSARC